MKAIDPDGNIVLGWKIPLSLKNEVKKIALRENRDAQEILVESLQNYVKTHGSGNPIYSLDKWNDPDFKATPAFGENLNQKWIPFLQISKDASLDEVIDQANKILTYASAYRNMKPEERSMTGFGTFRDAEVKARS